MRPVFGLIALAGCLALPATADARSCVVSALDDGSASIARGDSRIDLPSDTVLEPGDRVIKAPSAKLTVSCDDGAEIRIAAGSSVDLGPLIATDPGTPTIINLLRGIAGFVFPQGEGVIVVTPNAVTAVRSTEWTVALRGGVTEVFVREGIVDVAGGEGGPIVQLRAGDGIEVSPGGVVGTGGPWPGQRVRAMNSRLGGSWSTP